jgi:putative ABC transport system substrate-binding protein
MRRREFIAALGGASAWPLVTRAQQAALPVIGFLAVGRSGFVESQNLGVEYRWADNDLGRLPELADDLVRRRVSVIVAPDASAALAAKAATVTIPVVFWSGVDAVEGEAHNQSQPAGRKSHRHQLHDLSDRCQTDRAPA